MFLAISQGTRPFITVRLCSNIALQSDQKVMQTQTDTECNANVFLWNQVGYSLFLQSWCCRLPQMNEEGMHCIRKRINGFLAEVLSDFAKCLSWRSGHIFYEYVQCKMCTSLSKQESEDHHFNGSGSTGTLLFSTHTKSLVNHTNPEGGPCREGSVRVITSNP